MSEQPSVRVELSRNVGGDVVQAGTYTEVWCQTQQHDRVQHAVALRAYRLAVYEEFLDAAVQLARRLQNGAARIANVVENRLATPDLAFTLERDVKQLRAPIDDLGELK